MRANDTLQYLSSSFQSELNEEIVEVIARRAAAHSTSMTGLGLALSSPVTSPRRTSHRGHTDSPPPPPPPPLPPRWSAADPYVVLGVPAGAPRPQLRKAYLALALQYHPDKNTNASASGAFAAISRAWKAVSSA